MSYYKKENLWDTTVVISNTAQISPNKSFVYVWHGKVLNGEGVYPDLWGLTLGQLCF